MFEKKKTKKKVFWRKKTKKLLEKKNQQNGGNCKSALAFRCVVCGGVIIFIFDFEDYLFQ